MDFEALKDILLFVGGCVSSVAMWLYGRRKQKNDFLAELQKSINLLTTNFKDTLEKNVKLELENANLRIVDAEHVALIKTMEGKIDNLTKKVDSLTRQLKNYEKNNQGASPYTYALARNALSGGVRADQGGNDLEVRDDGRGGAAGRKCRSSGRGRSRRAAAHPTAGGDTADDNEAGGVGIGTCGDEFTDGTDTEPP